MTSSQNTVIVPSTAAYPTTGAANGTITDAANNVWTITASRQVSVNGVADPTTNRVTELAYSNGHVWQENTDKLWWAKSSPTDSWSPTYGTSDNPVDGSTFNLALTGLRAREQ